MYVNFVTQLGPSELLMKNKRSLTEQEKCATMRSGLKSQPQVVKNRQKPSKIRFTNTPFRIIKSALDPGCVARFLTVPRRCPMLQKSGGSRPSSAHPPSPGVSPKASRQCPPFRQSNTEARTPYQTACQSPACACLHSRSQGRRTLRPL